jgi:hypothetical protein
VQATQTGVPTNYGTRQITIEVSPMVVTTGYNLPYGNVNVVYGQTLTATGGTGALTWSLAAGTYLPPGLSLNPSTGVIGGTPLGAGLFFFNVIVRDSAAHSAVGNFSMSVYPTNGVPPLAITTGPGLGTWTLGPVQVQLDATGGTGGYTWAYVSGTLPPGLSLRTDVPSFFSPGTAAGLIGVATAPGNYSFTLSVTSGTSTVSQTFTMRITGLLLKDQSGMPDAFVGSPYTYQFTALNNAGTGHLDSQRQHATRLVALAERFALWHTELSRQLQRRFLSDGRRGHDQPGFWAERLRGSVHQSGTAPQCDAEYFVQLHADGGRRHGALYLQPREAGCRTD